jgi:predicted dehydrogenase
VASVWTNTRRIAAAGDAEDHLKIILEGKNGRLVDLEISGGSALGEPEWMVFGAKGALSCSGSQIRLRYLNPKKKLPARRAIPTTPPQEGPFGGPDSLEWIDETIEAKSPTGDDMGSIWEHLYRSLREGRAFAVTLPEALEVMRIISIAKKGIRFTTNR